jgi:hypothetical protein
MAVVALVRYGKVASYGLKVKAGAAAFCAAVRGSVKQRLAVAEVSAVVRVE